MILKQLTNFQQNSEDTFYSTKYKTNLLKSLSVESIQIKNIIFNAPYYIYVYKFIRSIIVSVIWFAPKMSKVESFDKDKNLPFCDFAGESISMDHG